MRTLIATTLITFFLVVTMTVAVQGLSGCSETPINLEARGPRGGAGYQITRPDIMGSTSDLLAAIAAADTGDTIRVPSGLYILEAQITLSQPLTLYGEGNVVFELADSVSQSSIFIGNYSGGWLPVYDIHVKNINIIGNRLTQEAGAGVAVIMARDCSLEDMVIADCYEDGVYISGATNFHAEDLNILRCGRNGLAFGEAIMEASSGCVVIDVRAVGNAVVGIAGEPMSFSKFIDCVATDNFRYGILVGLGDRSQSNAIIGCRAEHNVYSGIEIWAEDTLIENCTTQYNYFVGIAISGPPTRDTTVLNCEIRWNGFHGIISANSVRTHILQNLICNNGLDTLGDGIHMFSEIAVPGTRIIGNTIRGDSHNNSITILPQVLDSIVRDNNVDGPIILNR